MDISATQLQSGEQPTFYVGAAGFSVRQRQFVGQALSRSADLPIWKLVDGRSVDAWIANGSKAALTGADRLRIEAGAADEVALTLDMSDAARPVAFAAPLRDENIEARCVFDLAQPNAVRQVLLDFDAYLGQVHAHWLLGMHVVQLGASARHTVFHVSWRDQLLAVMDFRQGRAAIAPDLRPINAAKWVWSRRPDSASDAPSSFVRSSPARLAWEYVRRSVRHELPERYKSQTIYYRSRPRVPAGWLSDLQLMMLRELATRPQTLLMLHDGLKQPVDAIARDLACLYYAGSITTSRSKAGQPATVSDNTSSGPTSSPSLIPNAAPGPAFRGDPTVPAALNKMVGSH